MKFLAALAFALLGFVTASTAARADGEIGLVIQIGNEVETHCVAYSGESITGEQALFAVGKSLEQFGTGARSVCAIDSVGCQDASSFSSCFCECQGRECTYWAFFTREYGANWVYSSLGFNLLRATDGDVHGWKWGAGGPSSAPAPVDVSFDQICGHPPRSLVPPTATPTTPPAATSAPPTPTAAATPAGTAETPAESPTVDASPGQTTTAAPSDSPTAAASSAVGSPTVVVTIAGTPQPPNTAEPGDDGGSSGALIAFGAIAVVLIAAIGAAAVWRQRHGA